MSAIFGLIHLDGQPASADHLALMRAALADYGPDGGTTWHHGAAGLGQLLLASTPEASHERMPWAAPGGELAFSAAGRLDNRAELLASLDIAVADQPGLADGTLMLRAYQRWGEGCVDRLLGDWAFAAWHPGERRLVLARDQLGVTGLYFYAQGGLIAFASGLPGLLALPFVPRRLHEPQLARLLAALPADGFATLYKGISRLPPAHLLVATPDGTRLHRYWRLEEAPDVRLPSDEAYLAAFLEQFEAAVEARLRATGPIGVTLSAGLDSGTVAALAARALRDRGAGLSAFTARPHFPAQHLLVPRLLADEWPYAQRVAAQIGVAEHIAISAADFSPSQALAWGQHIFAEPQHAATNLHWLRDLLATAQGRGVGVLLTGQLGNAGVSWAGDPARVFTLLRAGQPGAALRALAVYRVASGRSWAGTIRRQLLGPLRHSLRQAARAWSKDWRFYAPLSAQLARRVGLDEQIWAARRAALTPDDRDRRIALLNPARSPAGALWHTLGAAYGLEIRDPTADIRLLQFCVGLPPEQYRRGDQGRLLLRRALAGQLPDEVLHAPWVGRQGVDLGQRLLADRAAIEELLARIERSDACAHALDLAGLRDSWAALQHALTPATNARAMTYLIRGLSAGRFLLTFEHVD